jgi:DNA-binding protein HU-beta
MTKADFIKLLKEKGDFESLAAAERGFAGFVKCLETAIVKKKGFTILGFGSFKVVNRKGRKGRNPQTGKPITIPAKRVVKFTASQKIKSSL